MAKICEHRKEVESGERFEFGENWKKFLLTISEDRIEEAKLSLLNKLEVDSLVGKSFLDIGSGSGLFSLAARLLGARVHSFDYDPQSVACTAELKNRYFQDDRDWLVEQGSVLDDIFLSRLKEYDVVYSWGVLHHTGDMWEALDNVSPLVKSEGGQLFIAIYNDQGRASKRWHKIKMLYNTLPSRLHFLVLVPSFVWLWGPSLVRDVLRCSPFCTWRLYFRERGMNPLRDLVDWVGGYPFEVAKPEQIFDFYRAQGFTLERLLTCAGGIGCNEYVFTKN